MIRCGICHALSEPGEKVVRVVTKWRLARYPHRVAVHRVFRNGREEWKDDPGGHGVEAEREVLAHKECAWKFEHEGGGR